MQLLLGKVWGEERQKTILLHRNINISVKKRDEVFLSIQYSRTPQILNDVIWIFWIALPALWWLIKKSIFYKSQAVRTLLQFSALKASWTSAEHEIKNRERVWLQRRLCHKSVHSHVFYFGWNHRDDPFPHPAHLCLLCCYQREVIWRSRHYNPNALLTAVR